MARPDPWKKVNELAEEIQNAPPSRDRGEMARQLQILVDRRARKSAPKELIERLINLMSDENVEVRLWTAAALGDLGPQAAPAIPALEKARKEDEALLQKIGGGRSGIWVMDAVDVALEKIRGKKK
jgi:HEAT repeat protein